MSGFSPEWLALREPVDHRSRDRRLEQLLGQAFSGRDEVRVVDLGCGTGSNLRATHRLLGARQHWTLVDHSPELLEAARSALATWADAASATEEGLVLRKGAHQIAVRLRRADLACDVETAVSGRPDLVTASALFDLCSVRFIARVARAVTVEGAVFYTVLTYDGRQVWEPAHSSDSAMLEAFHAHQATDKGFGVSAGPGAPHALRQAFEQSGYRVEEGDSPWRLGAAETALVASLAEGFAGAVRDTGLIGQSALSSWRLVQRRGALVGHLDTLALPPRRA